MLPLVIQIERMEERQADTCAFARSPVRVGRNPLSDLQLDESFVSQWHGVIRFDETRVTYLDLGATNGTLVDGQPIQRNVEIEVSETTDIRIGTLRLHLLRVDAPPELFGVRRKSSFAAGAMQSGNSLEATVFLNNAKGSVPAAAPSALPAALQAALQPAAPMSFPPKAAAPPPIVARPGASPVPERMATRDGSMAVPGGPPASPPPLRKPSVEVASPSGPSGVPMVPTSIRKPSVEVAVPGPPPVVRPPSGGFSPNAQPIPRPVSGGFAGPAGVPMVPTSIRKPSGELSLPDIRKPSGELSLPEARKPSGEVALPGGRKPSGEVAQPLAAGQPPLAARGRPPSGEIARDGTAELEPIYREYRAIRDNFLGAVRQRLAHSPDKLDMLLRSFPELANEPEYRPATSYAPPAAYGGGQGGGSADLSDWLRRLTGGLFPQPGADTPENHALALERVGAVLEVFSSAFIELRSAHEQFCEEMALERPAVESMLNNTKNPRAVLAYLLNPDTTSQRKVDDLSRALADFAVHQVALVSAVVEGARDVLQSLSPATLSGRTDRPSPGVFSKLLGNDLRALWTRYVEVFDETFDEDHFTRKLFGRGFARKYYAITGGQRPRTVPPHKL